MACHRTETVELWARGRKPFQFVRCVIPAGGVLRLGRLPQNACVIPWDQAISREQAELWWEAGRLTVRCLEAAPNPLVFGGQALREIKVSVGDVFRIGSTVFEVTPAQEEPAAPDLSTCPIDTAGWEQPDSIETVADAAGVVEERVYSAETLRRVAFDNASRQLEILSDLPRLISASRSDRELARRLVRLLLAAVPHCEAAAVVEYDVAALPQDASSPGKFPSPRTAYLEVREGFGGRFRPSRRLITSALTQGKNFLQIWGDEDSQVPFTMSEGLKWALVVPVPGESCRGWCLYLAGKGTRHGSLIVTENDLRGDLRFAELVAQFIGSIRQTRLLHEQRTQLSSFFSPMVIEKVMGAQFPSVLTPAERDVSVLFCDVRGFVRMSEELQHDLPMLLARVSAALGVMARGILDRDGALADFQGDAALGFWGWPMPLEDGPLAACRAALDICGEFAAAQKDPAGLLHGFSVGIGIACGRAIAGQIGTAKQAKVGVLGPVVNRGSRLEGMTKQFGVSICVDAETAEFVRRLLPPSEGRLRRLARVYPLGIDTPSTVYAVVPPERDDPQLTDAMLADHEAAVDAVLGGHWSEARRLLDRFPEGDGPAAFLRSYLDGAGTPAADWDGVISLRAK